MGRRIGVPDGREEAERGHDAVAVGEKQGELVGLHALGFQEDALGLLGGECPQHDVVGQIVGVGYADERVDAQRVAPDGVVADVGLRRRHYDVVVEGLLLSTLAQVVVAVHVLQTKDAVGAWRDAFDHEVTVVVGASIPQHGLGGERGILQIGIQAYLNALHGLQVLGIQDIARDFHRVDGFAGGERIGKVAQGVAFVVVGNGIAEVDGIGGVLFQRVEQVDEYALACALYFRHFQLGRRHNDVLRGVVHLDVLVEVDGHALRLHACGFVGWGGADDAWRLLVVPSAVGVTHAGARGYDRQHKGGNRYLQDAPTVALRGFSVGVHHSILCIPLSKPLLGHHRLSAGG